jgi:ribosomal protein L37AE/L43A
MKYKCNKCGKIVERNSVKRWIPSMCDYFGVIARLYLIKD